MNGVSTGQLLLRLAQAWTDGSALPRAREAGVRALVTGATVLLATVLFLAALGCALTALWLHLVPVVGSVGAPLIVSGVLLSLGGVAIVLPCLFRGRSKTPPPPPQSATPEAMIAEASRMVRENTIPVLISALLVGFGEGMRKK